MYKRVIRPLLFSIDPERIHHFTFKMIQLSAKIPGLSAIIRKKFSVNDPNLAKEVFGLKFKNPVGIAAGFDKNALIINELENFGFGFVEIGTVTPKPQIGNPKKRLFRLKKDQGLINRMGFNNDGVDVISKRLKNKSTKLIIGGNIGKNTATPNDVSKPDFIENFEKLHPYVDYFVVNVSCPNVGDTAKLQDRDFLVDLLSTLKSINETKTIQRPILLKIAPDLNNGQLDEIIDIVFSSKIEGVIASNTSVDRSELITSKSELDAIGSGGLSGKPIGEKSTKVIRYLSEKSNKGFVIIGVGGIHSADDAIEKLEAGADLVQLYTGFIYEGPALVRDINKAILKNRK
ncbi:quinone-dependent dihydroorotate dehydrogenase [Crocinitomix catalasitica]|uniref:quinone-dependent dihydroorotate dehydrogenase n=1 Tax=Crocinitomix catalasitica TaxID=184607 RepID=UPI0004841A20|nr:quinone-dependent dihydroorotate dehydrogenase [Crocinitomix catalasitica]